MKYFIFLFLIISFECNCQTRAVVKESGKEVDLYDNGTWKYVIDEPYEIVRTDTLTFNKSKESGKLNKSSKLSYGVWTNKRKWSCERSKDGDQEGVEFKFTLIGQDAYGMTISERIEIPVDNLVDIAIQNAEKAAPDTKIIRNESMRVNGSIVRFLQMEGTARGVKLVYYGYYYSDKNGSIQFITYTSKNLLKEYKNEMEALLNGFVPNEAGVEASTVTPAGFEKKVTVNENVVLHYSKDIDEAIPTQITHFMTKNGYINPNLSTEMYMNVEDNTYKLKFVKDDSILSYKEVVLAFNVFELKLNTNLKLNKQIVLEFTNEDLTKTITMPRDSGIINKARATFKLKIYNIDDYHSIHYNETMPISEVKKMGEAVKRLKRDFPDTYRTDLVFLNNGSDYTLKFFISKKYWNNSFESERAKRIANYFKYCGIRKKIKISFVDFVTFEEMKI